MGFDKGFHEVLSGLRSMGNWQAQQWFVVIGPVGIVTTVLRPQASGVLQLCSCGVR